MIKLKRDIKKPLLLQNQKDQKKIFKMNMTGNILLNKIKINLLHHPENQLISQSKITKVSLTFNKDKEMHGKLSNLQKNSQIRLDLIFLKKIRKVSILMLLLMKLLKLNLKMPNGPQIHIMVIHKGINLVFQLRKNLLKLNSMLKILKAIQ